MVGWLVLYFLYLVGWLVGFKISILVRLLPTNVNLIIMVPNYIRYEYISSKILILPLIGSIYEFNMIVNLINKLAPKILISQLIHVYMFIGSLNIDKLILI